MFPVFVHVSLMLLSLVQYSLARQGVFIPNPDDAHDTSYFATRGAAAWEGAGAGVEGQAEDYESSDACSSTSADYYEEVGVVLRILWVSQRCHTV